MQSLCRWNCERTFRSVGSAARLLHAIGRPRRRPIGLGSAGGRGRPRSARPARQGAGAGLAPRHPVRTVDAGAERPAGRRGARHSLPLIDAQPPNALDALRLQPGLDRRRREAGGCDGDQTHGFCPIYATYLVRGPEREKSRRISNVSRRIRQSITACPARNRAVKASIVPARIPSASAHEKRCPRPVVMLNAAANTPNPRTGGC